MANVSDIPATVACILSLFTGLAMYKADVIRWKNSLRLGKGLEIAVDRQKFFEKMPDKRENSKTHEIIRVFDIETAKLMTLDVTSSGHRDRLGQLWCSEICFFNRHGCLDTNVDMFSWRPALLSEPRQPKFRKKGSRRFGRVSFLFTRIKSRIIALKIRCKHAVEFIKKFIVTA